MDRQVIDGLHRALLRYIQEAAPTSAAYQSVVDDYADHARRYEIFEGEGTIFLLGVVYHGTAHGYWPWKVKE